MLYLEVIQPCCTHISVPDMRTVQSTCMGEFDVGKCPKRNWGHLKPAKCKPHYSPCCWQVPLKAGDKGAHQATVR